MDDILPQIDSFRKTHGLSPTAFGLLAANDKRLIPDLRRGRELRRATVERVITFMRDYEAEKIAA
jgi:hypothetical protein